MEDFLWKRIEIWAVFGPNGQLSCLYTLQIYTVFNCVHFPLQFSLYGFFCHIQSNVKVTLKNCKSVYNHSTVLGGAIKCNPYSETTVESQTHLKTVKITLNIFAV